MLHISVSSSSTLTLAIHSDMSTIKCSSRLKTAHCRGAGRRRRLQFKPVSRFYVTFLLRCCSQTET